MGARLAEIIERALGLAQQGGEGAGLQRTIAKIRRAVPGGGAHGGIPRMHLDLAFLGRIGQGVDPGLVAISRNVVVPTVSGPVGFGSSNAGEAAADGTGACETGSADTIPPASTNATTR